MAFQEITKQEGWNDEVCGLGGGFLQSWEWGAFQEKAGFEVLRLKELFSGALAQVVKRPLMLDQFYWYCPRGPIYKEEGKEVLGAVPADELLEGGMFFRFEPAAALGERELKKVRSVQPSETLILDTSKSPDELLANMHEKTRYNIRLAEKKGVVVFPASKKEDGFEIFWELLQETTGREQFRSHGKEYYKTMLEVLTGDPADRAHNKTRARLLFAEHDGKVLAAILLIYFGDTVVYLHGASSRERKELMAPYLLHWSAIQEAIEWGYQKYDFWGVAPMKKDGGKLQVAVPNHPWAGITRFKKGFGGSYVEYPGTFDLPLKKNWYKVYSFIKSLRP